MQLEEERVRKGKKKRLREGRNEGDRRSATKRKIQDEDEGDALEGFSSGVTLRVRHKSSDVPMDIDLDVQDANFDDLGDEVRIRHCCLRKDTDYART